jgi:hypothetical protein
VRKQTIHNAIVFFARCLQIADPKHGKKNVLIQAGLVDLSFLYNNNNYVSTTITPSSLCKNLTNAKPKEM